MPVLEFTGERVIPGQVDVDLWNEHVARYSFAARLAGGKRVLDAGCGAGYGSAELVRNAAWVVGADIATEAVRFARAHYPSPNLQFEQASCTALPHPDGSFDLVVAFEVIEHLHDWRAFLLEARRLLAPGGQFVVSTPNRLYYAESRGSIGANPFHVHEFDFEEFRTALSAVFPDVSLFLENHVEGFTFQPREAGPTAEVRVDAGQAAPDESHFFVAVCAPRPQLGNPTFVYIPRSANLLRERQRHIALLEDEVHAKDQWLEELRQEREQLLEAFRQIQAELERGNEWARSLDAELSERRARIVELQEQLGGEQRNARQLAEGYEAQIAATQDNARRMAEGYEGQIATLQDNARQAAQGYETQIAALQAEIVREQENARALVGGYETQIAAMRAELVREQENAGKIATGYAAKVAELERDIEDKTRWARDLEAQLQAASRMRLELEAYRHSRWLKLGQKIGLGPTSPAP